MIVTADQLKAIAPTCGNPLGWEAPINDAIQKFGIVNYDELCAFLAQIAVESSEFNRLEESLYYTAARLRAVWPRRFPDDATAAKYEKNPHALASYVYANRLGNGDEASGDGWTYRGRGLIQITGKSNYSAMAQALGDRAYYLCPDTLCTKQGAAMSAAWYWKANPRISILAHDAPDDDDEADFITITRLVNGGTMGLDQRRAHWERAKQVLK